MKEGDCELCGIWDSDLIDGECSSCREKYSHAVKQKKPESKEAQEG